MTTVHVQGVSDDELARAVLDGARKQGLEVAVGANASDADLVEIVVAKRDGWHSLFARSWELRGDLLADEWRDAEWALHLSRALRAPTLSIFT